MNAPADVEVRGRTREVAREVVGSSAPERLWRPRSSISARRRRRPRRRPCRDSSTRSAGGALSAPSPVVRDPSDVRGNTLYYAKSVFGNSYGYIWWIPLHNFLLRHVWAAFGAGDTVAGMLLTFACPRRAALPLRLPPRAQGVADGGGHARCHAGGRPGPRPARSSDARRDAPWGRPRPPRSLPRFRPRPRRRAAQGRRLRPATRPARAPSSATAASASTTCPAATGSPG